jgi:hypothetical protein
MSRDIAQGRKPKATPAATPRQVALVVPYAAADAEATFESALEVLDQDLSVHTLWRAQPSKRPPKRRAKSPA